MTELLRDQQTLLTILALMTPLITLDHHFFISFNDLTNRKTSSINQEDYIPLSPNFKHPAPDRIYVLEYLRVGQAYISPNNYQVLLPSLCGLCEYLCGPLWFIFFATEAHQGACQKKKQCCAVKYKKSAAALRQLE